MFSIIENMLWDAIENGNPINADVSAANVDEEVQHIVDNAGIYAEKYGEFLKENVLNRKALWDGEKQMWVYRSSLGYSPTSPEDIGREYECVECDERPEPETREAVKKSFPARHPNLPLVLAICALIGSIIAPLLR